MSSSNHRPANRGFRSVLRCAISIIANALACLHQNHLPPRSRREGLFHSMLTRWCDWITSSTQRSPHDVDRRTRITNTMRVTSEEEQAGREIRVRTNLVRLFLRASRPLPPNVRHDKGYYR